MLNLDVTPLIAQALLFTAGADLGYRIFVVANEKFVSVFVRAVRKSDVLEFVSLLWLTGWNYHCRALTAYHSVTHWLECVEVRQVTGEDWHTRRDCESSVGESFHALAVVGWFCRREFGVEVVIGWAASLHRAVALQRATECGTTCRHGGSNWRRITAQFCSTSNNKRRGLKSV